MDWVSIGGRIRRQREFLGYTREQFAELLDVTPKFCSDIELGVKGMSVQTLCRISEVLRLSTDFILFGRENTESSSPITQLLRSCSSSEQAYAEQLLKTFIMAMNGQKKNRFDKRFFFCRPLPMGNGLDLTAVKQVFQLFSGEALGGQQVNILRRIPKGQRHGFQFIQMGRVFFRMGETAAVWIVHQEPGVSEPEQLAVIKGLPVEPPQSG